MRRLIAILALFPDVALAADTDVPEAAIDVKPMLCIVDKRTPTCDITFVVAWTTAERGYYCVLNDLEADPLRCWSEQRAGRHDDHRSVEDSFSYRLEEGHEGAALASATVEVLRKDSDDRRRRRRTRHVWDVL